MTGPFWGAHAPRVLISAPRRNYSLVRSKKVVGEAPTTAREAHALPRLARSPMEVEDRLPILSLPHRTTDGMIIASNEYPFVPSR